MDEMQRLIELAVKRLWVAEVSIDRDGEICFNIATLDESLRATCRLSAKGRPATWAPFALCASPEAADVACDTLLSNIRRIARENGRRAPRTTEEKLARLMRRSAWQWANQQCKNEPDNEMEDEEVASANMVAVPSDEEQWEH